MLTDILIKYSSLFLKNVDKDSIRMFLESSPQYPNLLSVLQTLRFAGLDAQAGQCDWEYLKTVVSPVMLHLRMKEKESLIIARWNATKDCLEIFHPRDRKWISQSDMDIMQLWDGVVIYANDQVLPYNAVWQKTLRASVIGIILSLVGYSFLNPIFSNFIPAVIGIVVCCCLYLNDVRDGNVIIDKFCHISSITDCNLVEDSKYSSIYGLKMNNLALSFFFSQIISIGIGLLFGIENMVSSLYFIAALSSLPVIAYSIYGQYRIGRICPLCVMITVCIAFEAYIFMKSFHILLNYRFISLFVILFILTVAVFQYISYLTEKRTERLSDGIKFLKLKRKKDIILSESDPTPGIDSQIWLGDEVSPTILSTIISPGCKHCRKVVSELITLYKKGIKFRWNIILGQTQQTDSELIDLWIQHFLTDRNMLIEYLTLWSDDILNKKLYNDNTLETNVDVFAIRQSFDNLIANLGISGYPQIILNGRMLSPAYTVKDMEFIILDQNIKQ